MPEETPKLLDDLQRRKQTAEIEKLEFDLEKARREERNAIATQDRQRLAQFVPDLSKVTGNTLENKATGTTFSSVAAQHALLLAGAAVAQAIERHLVNDDGTAEQILLTTVSDLATEDLVYWEVRSRFDELIKQASTYVLAAAQEGPSDAPKAAREGLAAAVGLAAAALPQLVSLFTSDKALKQESISPIDSAAVVAVTAKLKEPRKGEEPKVWLDDFRLVTTKTPIHLMDGALLDLLGELRSKVTEALRNKAASDTRTAQYREARATQEELLKGAAENTKPEIRRGIQEIDGKVDEQVLASSNEKVRADEVAEVIKSAGDFIAAARVSPPTGRSPFSRAALMSLLRGEAVGDNGTQDSNQQEPAPPIPYVLQVKALAGQANEAVTSRKLGSSKFTNVVDASIAYVLLDVASGRVLTAGIETRVVAVRGVVGELPTIEPVSIST